MEESKEMNFVCKFCNKKFPSGKSLGGHIRIHSNESSVDSDSYNGNRLRENPNKNQRFEIVALKQKQQQQQQLCCRECGKGFVSLTALCAHACHSTTTRKRSKRVRKQSKPESFSNETSSSASEIDQVHKGGAFSLMMMSKYSNFKKKGHNLVMDSLAEYSDNNSVVLETKSSSGEQQKIFNVESEVLETDKVAVDDQLRSADDNGAILSDSYSSDSDYYLNGPKKSGFNSSFNRFSNSDELRVNEGRSKYENGAHSLETDSYADTNSRIHRFSNSKSPLVSKAGDAKKKSEGHECPICFKMFKSGQALGGHKRSHSIGNQEHRIEHQVAEMRNPFDLNLPASDIDE